MIDKRRLFYLPIIIIFLCQVISGCHRPPAPAGKPVVILTNSKGQKVAEFDVLDAVHGNFSRLLPNTRYDIQVVRSDGKEISRSSFNSDKRGIIPTSVLWWDIGVEYPKSRVGKLKLSTLYQYTYTCLLIHNKKTILESPIKIRPLEKMAPIIYSSNENGDPLNGFVHRKESVYLTGNNFPPGCRLYIYVVRDRYTWEIGDKLDPVLNKALILQLDEGQKDFTTLICPNNLSEIGSYDVFVEYEARNGIFDHEDLSDSHYGVGFTIFFAGPPPGPPTPPPQHIEDDLACQAPPQDNSGNVIGAPNPIYKDIFAPVEEVWVAVNPKAGGGNYVGQSANLYIVNHMPQTGWTDGAVLTDVSGGHETTVIQQGCANVNYTRVWSNPTIGDYDVVVDFAPFGQYNVGTDIIDKLDDKGFFVPANWVCLESVSLNHNVNSNTSDALNIRIDKNEDVTVPEWQKAHKAYPAAYIKNKNITVKAVFSAAAGVNNAKIRAAVGYGSLGIIPPKNVIFTSGTSGTVSFDVTAPTPNQIKSFYQKWNWYCEDINGTGSLQTHFGSSKNKIFVVLAEPPAPWTTSGQSKPWADVLWRSCWWANGETTQEGAAEEIQHHLYSDLGGSYVYGSQYTGMTTTDFKMTLFLNNIPSIGLVNCYDMGKSLVSFSNAVGCGLTYKLSMPFGALNCEKAIGKGWNCSESFNNHGFGNISNNVFDACLKVDTDNDPASPPHTETWMTNEPWNSYNTKVVNSTADKPVPYAFGVK